MRTQLALAAGLALAPATWSQADELDLAHQPTLFVVGYAHLDTQWRWTYPQTIREFLAHTLRDNFALFETHPGYTFNFTGSRRYEMFAEYYPSEYAQLKKYVAEGRWFPCGSSVDENDTNTPSAESLVRNVLYGNRFFQREFGVTSEEYMLPDCFGFTAAVPSVLAHCGIKGFSTQKLTWGSVVGIPFNLGVWVGPDGRGVLAALNPGAYDGDITENLATSESWKKRLEANGAQSGVFADYRYYGTGDVGGAPREASVAKLEESMETDGPVRVVGGPAEELFRALTPELEKKLPRYQGELELTGHSAGSMTSQAYMKRWNRKNELLADAAERASVVAAWLGGRNYPAEKLERAWTLVLGSQMHDIVSGTALAKGYEYAWNDEVLAANQFGAVLEDAVGVVASQLDTRGDGQALVVFNPLSIERQDVVEAELPGDARAKKGVRVLGPDGQAVPAQILETSAEGARIAFLAKLPSVGFAVFVAKLLDAETPSPSPLRVAEQRLENERYVVTLNADGDLASIQDKRAKRELLAAPARLGLHHENPVNWPAWNQDWSDRQLPAKEFVGGPARFRVVERGPARVAVEVTRTFGGSTFVQRVRLAAGGAGDRVELDTDIAWTARERSLRAAFPLTVSNPNASYDLQTGVLERPNSHEKQFEYGLQQWLDLTDAKGDYGVTVMSDCKYAGDKPDDSTVRLTLLHTPGTHGGYHDQGTQDLGRHRVLYALSGHAGDWRAGKSALEAARLNQPLLAFRASAHEGALGKSFSAFQVSDENVLVQAVKQAEGGGAIVVRLRELSGRGVKGLTLSGARPIDAAREVDGQERVLAPATLRDGKLVCDIGGFELRAFALELHAPELEWPPSQDATLPLAFDADVVSTNANRADGAMDGAGRTLPAEQLPHMIQGQGGFFVLGVRDEGMKNALTCRGQTLALPSTPVASYDRLELLVACDAPGRGVDVVVQVDGKPTTIHVGPWTGFVGQWDRRLWQGDEPELAYGWTNALAGIEPGFVSRDSVAWFASHVHEKEGDAPYQYCYLYRCSVPLAPGARELRLPDDARVKVFAATVVKSSSERVQAAQPLFDTLDDHVQDAPRLVPEAGAFADAVELSIEPRLYWRPGSIRYTLDGSAPSASSPAYAGPFFVDHPTTIQSAVIDAAGRFGPVVSGKLEVHDVTPPRLLRVAAAYGSKEVRLSFSEPLAEAALQAKNYTLVPALAVRDARRGEDARTVVLELAAAPELERAHRLRIAGVTDASPAHNALAPMEVELEVRGPVYTLDELAPEQRGTEVKDVPELPIHARDAWTLNLFVRLEKQPDDRTLIAGFGSREQSVNGACRFLAKFPGGIHFWSHNCDVPGRKPLELGRWQMLSATYDGKVVRLYKDAELLGQREQELVDDVNAVQLAPLDPWDEKRRFEGELRHLTIWPDALGPDALRALQGAAALR